MDDELRQHSAPADRNKGPITAELLRLLPAQGQLLEIASGTGQHAAFGACALPGWQWQPTDLNPHALSSIDAWCEGLQNVRPALVLDVTASVWPGVPASVDAMLCANMLHIAPWAACAGLMQGAGRHLSAQGLLVLYGPYVVDGETTVPSNVAFDADLRRRNPDWGLRCLADVLSQAQAAGLQLQQRLHMPANNLLLVLSRQG